MATARRYHHHHYHFSYPLSFRHHFGSLAVVSAILILVMLQVFHLAEPAASSSIHNISITTLVAASLATLYRLSIAYVISLVISVPLALLITSTPKTEKYLLPLFDIIQSVPALAFFPLLVLLFIRFNFFEGAAIFILVLDIVWNLVFSMVGGLKSIPNDIKAASVIFGAKGFKKLWFVTLPSILPYIITGSFLAWGQGWNIIVVAEVLHNYIPGGNTSSDLFGLGSLLVNSTASGQSSVFLAGLITMVIIIGFLNFFVWQKLIHLTERYKFD